MEKVNVKELSTLISGWLTSFMILLGALNIKFEWLTEDSITAFSIFIIATVTLIAFLINIYAIYKNSYVITEKAKKQSDELERKGLK